MMITKNKFWASFILCHYAICIICTYSCSDNQKRFQEENADCKTETLKIKKNIPLEDFSVFIEKFHKDKEFQKNRLQAKVEGINGDLYMEYLANGDEYADSTIQTFVWDEKTDFDLYLSLADSCCYSQNFKKRYTTLKDSTMEEYIYIPYTGCFFKSYFKCINGVWKMTEFNFSNL